MLANVLNFRRPAPVPALPRPAPVSLADEAEAFVGNVDAAHAQTIDALEKYSRSLGDSIKRYTSVKAAVDAQLAREQKAVTDHPASDFDEALAAAVAIDLEGYDPADDARKSYEAAVEAKRKRGDKHWPERKSDQPAIAAE